MTDACGSKAKMDAYDELAQHIVQSLQNIGGHTKLE